MAEPPAINAVQQPAAAGAHGNHSATPATSAGASVPTGKFDDALNQAISQAPAADHGAHGGGTPGAGSAHGGGHSSASLLSSNSEPHPQHFPIGPNGHGGRHGLQEKMLGLRAYRQQLIASNIANADTPGYKAVDIDMEKAAQAIADGRRSVLPMVTSSAGHISASNSGSAPFPLKYQVPSQSSLDGNTVDMDIERQKFAENSIMYEFSLDRVSGHFKHLMELFQSLKD